MLLLSTAKRGRKLINYGYVDDSITIVLLCALGFFCACTYGIYAPANFISEGYKLQLHTPDASILIGAIGVGIDYLLGLIGVPYLALTALYPTHEQISRKLKLKHYETELQKFNKAKKIYIVTSISTLLLISALVVTLVLTWSTAILTTILLILLSLIALACDIAFAITLVKTRT